MQNPSTQRRPFGIGIIALLLFIQAIYEIVVGPFTFIGTYLANPFTGLVVSWMPLVVAVLLLILAWALWTLKRWAYWALLIVEIVNIVLHFLGYTLTHSILALWGGGILSVVVVIYLLVDGNVRRAFRTGV